MVCGAVEVVAAVRLTRCVRLCVHVVAAVRHTRCMRLRVQVIAASDAVRPVRCRIDVATVGRCSAWRVRSRIEVAAV